MTNGTKDWANIRIEEPVRDDARDDPRTYTEIMRAGLEADAEGVGDLEPFDGEVPAAELAAPADVRQQLDRIEAAAKEATNAAQNAERAAEELAGQR